jgi:hypothetical protein
MLHPAGISSIVVGFEFIDVNILSHCSENEKVMSDNMFHLLGAIRKTFSWAGINSNLHSSVFTDHPSK